MTLSLIQIIFFKTYPKSVDLQFEIGFKHNTFPTGEYAGDLVENQASALCGLREDDLVVAVNGDIVIGLDHTEVVKLIKSNPNHVVFVALGPNAEKLVLCFGIQIHLYNVQLTMVKLCDLLVAYR